MDDLTYTLQTLCQRNRDGSHATQADRLHTFVMDSPKRGTLPSASLTPVAKVFPCTVIWTATPL